MTDRVTRIGIQNCLDEVLSRMDGLAPSEAAVRNALEEIESRVIRLRLAVLMRGLEGAEPIPPERLFRVDEGKPFLRIVE
jgi:hypothetical protein